MNKIILLLVIIIVVVSSACRTTNVRQEIEDCERYVPMTEGNFMIALFNAMTEKAYAAYTLGFSELIIMQTLKDDFKFYYVSHAIGDAKNSYLNMGMSCSEALNSAYSLEGTFRAYFHEFALSAMKEGQKKVLSHPDQITYANKIIDEHPVAAIKNADKIYREQLEYLNGIKEK